MKKVLFVASVTKHHILSFHIPYLEWFKKNGYEVSVCSRNDFEEPESLNIPFCDKYYNVPFNRNPFNPLNIIALKMLINILRENKYDLIHCHTPIGGVLTRLAAFKTRRNGTKVLYTAHGFHFYKGSSILSWILYYPIERILSKITDAIITINNEDYKNALKFKTCKVFHVNGVGIDIDKFSKSRKKSLNLKNELGIGEDTKVIISVGELSKRKNHKQAIVALSKIEKKDFVYIICGQGSKLNYLKKLSKKYNLNVLFLGFRKDISSLLRISDVFLFPSLQEGLPVALVEAKAAGLPIVCSNIRGNSDVVSNYKGGYLVNRKNTELYSKYVYDLLMNDEKRISMGVFNIQENIKFSIDSVSTEIVRIYKEFLIK